MEKVITTASGFSSAAAAVAAATVCSIPTVAEELCTITVRTKPNRMPKTGFCRKVRKDSNTLVPIKGLTPSVIRFRPINRTPKPIQMSPMGFAVFFLINISRTIPMMSAMGAKVSVSNSHRNRLSGGQSSYVTCLVIFIRERQLSYIEI